MTKSEGRLKHPRHVWTGVEVEFLRKLWMEGHSTDEIARKAEASFGFRMTAAMVIGVANRNREKFPKHHVGQYRPKSSYR